jgi:hypothetical protein
MTGRYYVGIEGGMRIFLRLPGYGVVVPFEHGEVASRRIDAYGAD